MSGLASRAAPSSPAAPPTRGRVAARDADWPSAPLLTLLRAHAPTPSPRLGLVLGSGLGGVADALTDARSWPADSLEGYPSSTVAGHAGRLWLGRLNGIPVWVAQGRVHLYEGHAPHVVTRVVRLFAALGVESLVLTNAAGSLDPSIPPGSICLDADAISLFLRSLAWPAGSTALSPAPAWRRRGPLCDPRLCALAREVALEQGIDLHEAILAGSSGPSYETAAEVQASRRIGATVASMSTIPEALAAREASLAVLVFSLVTNLGTGLSSSPLTHEEVVACADRAGGTLARLLGALAPRL